jgi:hypothetical protein
MRLFNAIAAGESFDLSERSNFSQMTRQWSLPSNKTQRGNPAVAMTVAKASASEVVA